MSVILIIFFLAYCLRFLSYLRSRKNEAELKKAGAKEYGPRITKILQWGLIFYYLFCVIEAILRNAQFGRITVVGLGLYIFSMVILWTVIRGLGGIWTIKLFILPGHELKQSLLFKYFRHPNYFLNVIPELIGIALICQAWYTLSIGLPLFLIPLTIRIIQEEKAMKEIRATYQVQPN